MPTLADIATRTGVGTNTVSLALRNSTRISKAVRDKVQEAAREIGYIPNHVAKALASDRTNTVGLLVHEITNPILTEAAQLIQLELAAHGYSILFATSNDSFEAEQKAIEVFRSHMIDGLLVYPFIHDRIAHLVDLRSRNFPVVMLIGAKDCPVDAVGVDEFRGGYAATRHLIELGHDRIGTIIADDPINPEKFNGYKAALKEAGLRFEKRLVATVRTHSIEAAIEATGRLMQQPDPPKAVFACSDVLALGTLRWAASNRVPVPGKLAIVGFDDIDVAEHSFVSLSTVRNNVEEIAKRAVARLIELMKAGAPLPPPRTELIGCEVIARESSIGRVRRAVVTAAPGPLPVSRGRSANGTPLRRPARTVRA